MIFLIFKPAFWLFAKCQTSFFVIVFQWLVLTSPIKNVYAFRELSLTLAGEFYYDSSPLHQARLLAYSTDASVYQEKPVAVAIPASEQDIKLLIKFAAENNLTLIPRAAGTSLAGQVVGNGIVVDISVYFNEILEINEKERWVRVQPGIIRDDLNQMLKPYGLMFAPETSTASRAMIGGMIGNNSCGLHSIVWGDTRSHLLEAQVLLSDGSKAVFEKKSINEAKALASSTSAEGSIYKTVIDILSQDAQRELIHNNYPKKSLARRNTGYALDILANDWEEKEELNLCKLLSGSEGTLAFISEAKLNLIPLPPTQQAVVCIHCKSIGEAMQANLVALAHKPMASELVDKFIMDFTKGHPTYEKTRFFLEGEPEAVLIVEFMEDEENALSNKADALVNDLKEKSIGYARPVVYGEKTKLVWDVRKAGLGLIRNMPGNEQPVNLIEDCAVSPEDLPSYIESLHKLFKKYGIKASHYAHAGAGELHIEPLINLKSAEGQLVFRNLLADTALLVKQFNGSLSGEHGDGRLRGEFIPVVLGNDVHALLLEVKKAFDPYNVFNANKIVHTPPMDSMLRYDAAKPVKKVETIFDFSNQEGLLHFTEKCSGSGDCRRSHLSGGTMCPSYMATRHEKDTTRARANILRQFLTNSAKQNPFDHKEIKEVMDLCLSCKACKSECPSEVDITKMKAEFLQHYYDANGVPFRARLIGNFAKLQQMAMIAPAIYNFFATNKLFSNIIKSSIGFAKGRSLPTVASVSFRAWLQKHSSSFVGEQKKSVWLFCDEFTNYNDVEVGKATVMLLEKLGYEVNIPNHLQSGRTYLSKGLVRQAQKIINKNIETLSEIVTIDKPLIGIEPSAIITFRDEAPDLATQGNKPKAKLLASQCYLLEEFLWKEVENGNIQKEQFTSASKKIKLHGHCYQKAHNLVAYSEKILSFPQNYIVETIPSGCCGMAGAFGFEKEHFDVSMKVAELVLLPSVRNTSSGQIIAAAGTSCRHQIKDGAGVIAMHPAQILLEAVK